MADQEDINQESTSRQLGPTFGLNLEQILKLVENDASENSDTSLEGDSYLIYIYIYIKVML